MIQHLCVSFRSLAHLQSYVGIKLENWMCVEAWFVTLLYVCIYIATFYSKMEYLLCDTLLPYHPIILFFYTCAVLYLTDSGHMHYGCSKLMVMTTYVHTYVTVLGLHLLYIKFYLSPIFLSRDSFKIYYLSPLLAISL